MGFYRPSELVPQPSSTSHLPSSVWLLGLWPLSACFYGVRNGDCLVLMQLRRLFCSQLFCWCRRAVVVAIHLPVVVVPEPQQGVTPYPLPLLSRLVRLR